MRWIFLIFVSILFSHCTFQKRVYRKGFYTNLNIAHYFNNHKDNKEEKQWITSTKHYILQKKNPSDGDTCKDKLLFEDGREEMVKVLNISEDSVRYIWCNGSKNSIISVNKNYIKKIIYANGFEEEFEKSYSYIPKKLKQQETKKLKPDDGYLGWQIIINLTMIVLIVLGIIFYDILPFALMGFFSSLFQPYHARKIIRDSEYYENAEGKKMAGKILFYTGYIVWLLSVILGIILFFYVLSLPYFTGKEYWQMVLLISTGLSFIYLIILNITTKPTDW